ATHKGPRARPEHAAHCPAAPQLAFVPRQGANESDVAGPSPPVPSPVEIASAPDVASWPALPASADPASNALPPQATRTRSETAAKSVARPIDVPPKQDPPRSPGEAGSRSMTQSPRPW